MRTRVTKEHVLESTWLQGIQEGYLHLHEMSNRLRGRWSVFHSFCVDAPERALWMRARLMCQDACPVSLPVKDRLQMPSQSLLLTPDYARCTECSAHAGSTVN